MLTAEKFNWIWLPQSKYPDNQTTVYSSFMDKSKHTFTVAEFKKTYSFEKKVVKTEICFCAYTVFQLYCNNNCVAIGPVCEGGDFIANDKQPQKIFLFIY